MKNFNNHYRDNLLREEKLKYLENNLNEEFSKAFAFNKIISHINEQKNLDSNKFEVTVLEAMYKELLEYDNIPYTCHVSRFTERLMFSIPELEKRIICNRTYLCFSSEVSEIINEEIGPNSFIQSLLKLVVPIRAGMSTVQNRFKGTFSDDSQQNSIPIRLLSLCSMLIDGFNPKDTGFSQPALTVSQLIMHVYKKKINRNPSTIRRRHSKIRETPLSIYVGLKLYATVRSKTLTVSPRGLCII